MNYIKDAGDLRAYNLNCKILHKVSNDPMSKMAIQPIFWGVDNCQVLIKGSEIRAWSHQIGNVYDGLARTSRDKVSEARCDINSPNFLYIRFIPLGYRCTINCRPTTERRVEIASIRDPNIGDVSIVHFSSKKDIEFFAFCHELMAACKKPIELVGKFDWLGDQPKIVHGF